MELVYRSSSSVQGVEQAADINNGFLDIRLGPTLSCLVAEKKIFPNHLLFWNNNRVLQPPSPFSTNSSFMFFTAYPYRRLCCCCITLASLGIYLFSATKQDKVGLSVLSRHPLFPFCSFFVHTVQRNWINRLCSREIPYVIPLPDKQKNKNKCNLIIK